MTPLMNIPKPIRLLIDLAKFTWSLPHIVAAVLKRRRRQVVLDALEAERLDRIRNPSKYLGK
jgi:hypothetical protein